MHQFHDKSLHYTASNPETSPQVLDDLANHTLHHIAERVASNPNTPAETLSRLSFHDSVDVRLSVAENMNTTLLDLSRLARDENPDIRYRLAESPHLPIDLLKELAEDENPYVRSRAEKTINRLSGGYWTASDQEPEVQISSDASEQAYPNQHASAVDAYHHLTGEEGHQSGAPTSEYIRQISGRLRNMLSAIIGMNDLLLSTGLTAGQRELAQSVYDSSQSLLNFVHDLEDISRIEQVTAEIEHVPFNLIFTVQDAARPLAEVAREKGLILFTNVDQRIPEFVIGDPAYLRGILRSLIRLGIRSTEEGHVSVEALVESTDDFQITIRFTVRATVSGALTDEGLTSSKELFHYMPAEPGASGTTQLVEAEEGNLDVRRHNNGQAVSFVQTFQTLPSRKEEEPAAIVSDNALVLVVEDDPTLRWLTIKQLTKLGVDAHGVGSGRDAIAAHKEYPFDLILMDLYMTDIDGLDATMLIRDQESGTGTHTPIIAMTCAAMPGDDQKCLSAGMDDYLTKPVSQDQLLRKLSQWLPLANRETLGKRVRGSRSHHQVA
jgi:CheY-like chemotaxis protein